MESPDTAARWQAMMRSGVTRVGGGGQDSHPGGSMLGQLPAASGGFPPTTGAMPPAPSHPIYVQAPSAIYTSPEIGEAPPPRLQHDQATATAAPAALAHPYAHAQAHAHMMQAAAPHLYHHHRHQQPPAAAAAAAAMGSGYQSVYPHHRHPHHPSVMAAYPPHAQLMMGGAVPPGAMPLVPCAWPGPPAQAAPASPVAASATGFYHLDGSVPAAAAVASAPAPSWSRSAEGKAVPAVDGAAATAETAAGAGAGAGDVPKRRYRGKGKKAPLPVEARAERRKEKSRMYSAIARRRQEGAMKALRLKVETLCVFRLVIDEGPDLVLVLTPDVDARIGFASEASRRLLGVAHTALEGRSLWDLLHTDDKPAVLKVISETILGRGTRRRVDARIRARGPPPAPPEGDASAGEGPAGPQEGGEEEGPVEYMRVGVSMKYGPQGILAFLRPRLEEGGAAGAV